MELIKSYQKVERQNRISFSMYWDEIGTIQFCTTKKSLQDTVKIRYGKDIDHFYDELVTLGDLEEKFLSLLSCRFVFIFGIGNIRTEVLNVLNSLSCTSGCYAPIIGFKDSIIFFPKLRYNDCSYIKHLLNREYQDKDYQLFWACNAEGGC